VDFYKEFCPLVLYQSTCDLSYIRLNEQNQKLLQDALVQKVNLSCVDCPAGLDLSKLDFSIEVFGQSLLANCSQTGQIIYNVTGQTAGKVATYPDLWKFTLTNYNAGPGCLTLAIGATDDVGEELTWENVSKYLGPACAGAIGYVNDITSLVVMPTPFPTAIPSLTPTPILVVPGSSPTPTPIPSLTSTPILVPGSSPIPSRTPIVVSLAPRYSAMP
jgi:hypothetical protein